MVLWGMAAAAAAVGKLFLSDAIGAIATERFWRGKGAVVQIYYQK